MGKDTTTVRVYTSDKERINAMQGKQCEIIRDVLDAYEHEEPITEERAREIAEQVVSDRVIAEAQR